MLATVHIILSAVIAAAIFSGATPYSVAVQTALTCIPFAMCFVALRNRKLNAALAACIGLAAVALYSYVWVWLATASAIAIARRKDITRAKVISSLGVAGAVGAFYLAVFEANYVAAWFAHNRLHDPSVIAVDQAIYRALLGVHSYVGIFPLIGGHSFDLLSNAYFLLFSEVLVVALLMVREQQRFFAVLACAYGLGIALFLIWPVIGPAIFAPESFAGHEHSAIANLSRSELLDYRALFNGGHLSGFGYFVGTPSLHVLIAALLQGFLRRSRTLFYAFLPANLMIVASTFVLGQHYLLDVFTGAVLAIPMWRFTGLTDASRV